MKPSVECLQSVLYSRAETQFVSGEVHKTGDDLLSVWLNCSFLPTCYHGVESVLIWPTVLHITMINNALARTVDQEEMKLTYKDSTW